MINTPQQRRTTVWWIASIGLHVLVIAALVIFTPLREWLTSTGAAEPPRDVNQEKIDRWVEQLKAIYHRRLVEANSKLDQIAAEMQRLSDKRFQQLRGIDIGGDIVNMKPTEVAALQAERLQTQYRTGPDGRIHPRVPERLAPVIRFVTEPVDRSPQATASRSIVDLYDQARAAEVRIAQWHERLRAYDMSAQQIMPLKRAMEVTDLTLPRRDPIRRDIINHRITSMTDGRFAALKRELVNSYAESQDMIAKAERLLLLAKGILGEGDSGVVRWESIQPMAGAAREQIGEHRPYTGPSLFPEEIRDSPENVFKPEGLPIYAMRLKPGDDTGPWMQVNTWWIIGPFPHPGRDNPKLLDRKYPPENAVDLNASYEGKQGRTLTWRYRRMDFMRQEPFPDQIGRYAVYYMYTKIYSEYDQTLWCAFGSDDYGVVWVNGEVVWRASKLTHAWTPFGPDSFRQVRFKQGINDVLFKLENAGGTTHYSMIISTDEELVH